MVGRIDLGVGAVARAILSRPIGRRGARREVTGVAVVRVLESHIDGRYDVFRVEVLRSSEHVLGRDLELTRRDMYALAEPAELAAFEEMVTAIWGRGAEGDAARARVFGGSK